MTLRSALLIGVNGPDNAQPDVAAVSAALRRLGFETILEVSGLPTVAEVLAARDRFVRGVHPDGASILWVSGPARDGELILADGLLSLDSLTHEAPAVRSLLRVLDVPGIRVSPSADPTLFAANGSITAAFLEALATATGATSLGALAQRCRAFAEIHLAPLHAGDQALGVLIDGNPAHIPWVGVDAWFEFDEAWELPFMNGIGTLGFATGQEQWSFQGALFPNVALSGVGQPYTGQRQPSQVNFTNNGFTILNPPMPNLQPGDQAYQVSFPNSGITLVVARQAQAPTAMDWYTTQAVDRFPNQIGQAIQLVPVDQAAIQQLWTSSNSWRQAHEVPS